MIILYNPKNQTKTVSSPDYNYHFNLKTGEFRRWGKTFTDDPKVGMLEIFDLEVSEICSGVPPNDSDIAVPCAHCYKSNTKSGRNMSFDTFKLIFDKLPHTLTQIAFGIGDIDANPDLVKMFDYCRNNEYNPGVVPNLTINGYKLTDEWVNILVKYCGGIAVSKYENKDICYDAVKKLTDAGLAQVNVHMVISNENYDECFDLVKDAINDSRLSKMKAIVFLTLKQKGKRNKWTTIKDIDKYKKLVTFAMDNNIGIGFDSCSAPTFLAAMREHPHFDIISQLSESCESDRFSGYANVDGIWSHCSFTEGIKCWGTIDLKTITDFNTEVWNSKEVIKFRSCLTSQNNSHIGDEVYLCPVYKLYADEIGNSPTAIDNDIIRIKRI